MEGVHGRGRFLPSTGTCPAGSGRAGTGSHTFCCSDSVLDFSKPLANRSQERRMRVIYSEEQETLNGQVLNNRRFRYLL